MSIDKPSSFVPAPDAAADAERAAAALLPAGQKELSLDDAVKLAVRLHQEDRFDGARTLYQRILQAAPGHADVLGLYGVLEHQLGRSEAGLAMLREAIALRPDVPGLRLNLGNVLVEVDRLEEALQAFHQAGELDPKSADIPNNIGAVYRALNRYDEALSWYRRAIELDPKHVRAWNNIGLLHYARGNLEEATRAYLTAIEFAPGHGVSAYNLGMTFYKMGELAKAAEVFRQWMQREPQNPVPAHMYAACSGQNVPERASDEYVEAEFDKFASSFERVLNERLRYRAPQLCVDLLTSHLGAPQSRLDLLDAGCGTGLCGPLVAPWARQLVGVDLSAGMLAKARNKGVYHGLEKAELTAYLAEGALRWDAIVCADTLCYFGDLAELMRAAASSLRPGGVMVYTVEALADDSQCKATLLPSGRYAHGRAHLDQVSAAAGLVTLDARRDVLRDEIGAPVHGWLMAVQRPT